MEGCDEPLDFLGGVEDVGGKGGNGVRVGEGDVAEEGLAGFEGVDVGAEEFGRVGVERVDVAGGGGAPFVSRPR